MNGFEFLMQIGGGVALLLWATRLVRTGIERAFGPRLQRALGQSVQNRFSAFVAGLGVTAALQSSTATALLTTSFAQSGLIATAAGLAIMLGADVGSTAVVQILSFDIAWLAPALLIIGVGLFQGGRERWVRQSGRIAVGLGLMLISLNLIVTASVPLRDSEAIPVVVGYLAEDHFTAFLIGAILTWLAHSSVAIILLIASLATSGVIPIPLALALVLGANVGSGFIPFILTLKNKPEARRIPIGNLLMRLTGAIAMLLLLPLVAGYVGEFEAAPARQVANFHTAFNLVLALVFLPLIGVVAKVAAVFAKEQPAETAENGEDWETPSHLDPEVVDKPHQAIACATRELLRMADKVEAMLRHSIEMFRTTDIGEIRQLAKRDDEVDRIYHDLKLYLARISRRELTDEQANRCMQLNDFAIKLEQIGDIIERNLSRLAKKRAEGDLLFSEEGWKELNDLHARVAANMQLALNVLVSGDRETARELLSEKRRIRDLERESSDSHLTRLSQGQVASIRTSGIHLDAIKDLRQINSQLASVAYAVLDGGERAKQKS